MSHTLVIGLYEDNGQTYVAQVNTPTPEEAMQQIAQEVMLEPAGSSLIILGAVHVLENGHLEFTASNEDMEFGVYAEELAGGGDVDTA